LAQSRKGLALICKKLCALAPLRQETRRIGLTTMQALDFWKAITIIARIIEHYPELRLQVPEDVLLRLL
ncbi:hypothetical protein, partial [Candidatus Viridilinea mediisalina]|uniref:hypothetical protein n=1 Tax=Candidatus Viridilinea mediisalina TaxID=2024553 RepID=UPI001C2C1083